jgi:DNA-binding transcriptional LysR family regulator
MDLDARPYRAFVAVAETGSFSRAADRLNVSQPALSAQVRELERRVGFTLFARTSRRVELTADGSLFIDKARRLILETDWINQAARDIRTNQLRIGAAHFSALIPERCALIDRFMQAHSGVPLQVIGRSHAQLLADVARGDIDIAVTLQPSGPDARQSPAGTGEAADLDWRILGRRPVRVLLPAASSAASPDSPVVLEGMSIASINRAHGIPLSETIAHRLSDLGATLVHLPEGDAPAIARYAARLGQPAIDLGWFGPAPQGMVARDVAGLDIDTLLVVLAQRGARRAGAASFLDMLDQDTPRS